MYIFYFFLACWHFIDLVRNGVIIDLVRNGVTDI